MAAEAPVGDVRRGRVRPGRDALLRRIAARPATAFFDEALRL
ncbi:hypothetical protein [Burkholderia sp. MSMB1835]|nr:hypothetical protein [Burkholderia sp. MSMB1835]